MDTQRLNQMVDTDNAVMVAPVTQPDYLKVCHAAGLVLWNAQRGCYPDLWASWERLHKALGMPMDWRGVKAVRDDRPIDRQVMQCLNFVLRYLDTASALSVLADADRVMRRLRLTLYNMAVDEADQIAKRIDLHRDDLTTRGQEDQAQRIADLVRVRQSLASEYAVIGRIGSRS